MVLYSVFLGCVHRRFTSHDQTPKTERTKGKNDNSQASVGTSQVTLAHTLTFGKVGGTNTRARVPSRRRIEAFRNIAEGLAAKGTPTEDVVPCSRILVHSWGDPAERRLASSLAQRVEQRQNRSYCGSRGGRATRRVKGSLADNRVVDALGRDVWESSSIGVEAASVLGAVRLQEGAGCCRLPRRYREECAESTSLQRVRVKSVSIITHKHSWFALTPQNKSST